MRALVLAFVAFAPATALACAMPPDRVALRDAIAEIDEELVAPTPKPETAPVTVAPQPQKPAIPEVTAAPVVKPRS
ncbi:MAG: hypothetical protein ACOZNI_36065 [Myxococcota bacterium]